MASIGELKALAAKISEAQTPSADLDKAIAVVLGRLPADASMPPAWTASRDDALKLFHDLLPGRPMQLTDDPENNRFFCSVKLYGSMPACPPYEVASAKTAPLAILIAMTKTLIALEIDAWW